MKAKINLRLMLGFAPIGHPQSLKWLCPFVRTSTKQSHAFSVVGPSIWTGLPSQLRIFSRALPPAFLSHLKTAPFSRAAESRPPLRSTLEEALYKYSI